MKKLTMMMALFSCAWMMHAASYVQLTATNQLQAGDTVVWVNKTNLKGNTSIAENSKYMNVAAVELIGKDTIVSTELKPMVLGGSTGAWTFTYTNGTKIGRVNKETKFSTSANLTYTIEIGTDSNVVISSASDNTYKIFYNTSSPRFAFYTSTTMAAVQLFKKLPEGQGPAVKVTGVKLNTNSLTLRAGDSNTLIATVAPEDAKNKTITWGSVDESVATMVDGVVTAIAKGETKVWVKTEDGNFTDTCVVTVKQSASLPDVTWNILQTADSLKEGVKVLFGNAAKDYVMGLYNYDVANSNIRGVAATYGEGRHTVTASESNAYIVHRDGDKIYFEDIDGRYLYMYNTNKNLSANTTLNNQAKWTVTYNEDTAVIKSVYSSSWTIYFNKTAANPMYCTYQTFDANLAKVLLYTSNAPEWVEPVRVPELNILIGKDTITDSIAWGNVDYDDSWGTEANPYEASKELKFVTKDLKDSISLYLQKGTAFILYTERISPAGGKASIQFSTTKAGNYSDTLVLICDTIFRKIALSATARSEEETLPTLTLSTKAISMNIATNQSIEADADMTFSVKNLKKNLYIKWEKGTIPDNAGESVTILAGNDASEINFGSATNMGTSDRTNEDILFEAVAYTEGTYTSTLCFYTPDENDKNKNAFEERVTITIHVTDTPTSLYDVTTDLENKKVLKDNQLLIYHNGFWYNTLGRIIK